MHILPVDAKNAPVRFSVMLAEESFTFDLLYNERHDYYTFDLYKNEEPLVYGEKIVYGKALFENMNDERLPAPRIVPLDPSGRNRIVNRETLGETVFLVIDDEAEV